MSRRFAIFEQYRDVALAVYLAPRWPWRQALALQHRLVYELSGEPRNRAALLLCEHPPIITMGRQASHRHLKVDAEELRAWQIEVRWTNRGGGCWLHWPGQLAIYPIIPLDAERPRLDLYRTALYQALENVVTEFDVPCKRDTENSGLIADGREIASVGVAVKNWVAYQGCRLNVAPPLDKFDWVQSNPNLDRKMTSLFRERRLPVRLQSVRESIARNFVEVFGFRDHFLCHAPVDATVERLVHAGT